MNQKDQLTNAKKIYRKPVCSHYPREEFHGLVSGFNLRRSIARGLTHAQPPANPVLLVANCLGDAARVEIDTYRVFSECRIFDRDGNEEVFPATLSNDSDRDGMKAARLVDLREARRAIEVFLKLATEDCRSRTEVIVVLLPPDANLSLWRQLELNILWELHSPVSVKGVAETLKAFLKAGARAFSAGKRI